MSLRWRAPWKGCRKSRAGRYSAAVGFDAEEGDSHAGS